MRARRGLGCAYACLENALAYLVLLGFGALGASWRTSLSVADWNGEVIQTDQHDSRDRQGAGDGFCRSRRPHHRLSHTNTPLGAARTRRRGVLRQRLCRREVAAGLASTTYTDVGILANSRFAEFFYFFVVRPSARACVLGVGLRDRNNINKPAHTTLGGKPAPLYGALTKVQCPASPRSPPTSGHLQPARRGLLDPNDLAHSSSFAASASAASGSGDAATPLAACSRLRASARCRRSSPPRACANGSPNGSCGNRSGR